MSVKRFSLVSTCMEVDTLKLVVDSIAKDVMRDFCKFHRGLRARRFHEVLLMYLGGLRRSELVKAIESLNGARKQYAVSEVGLLHSSDEVYESRWSEGNSK